MEIRCNFRKWSGNAKCVRAGAKSSFPARCLFFLSVLVPFHTYPAVGQNQPPGLPAGATIICQTEQAIGFRWVRGKWKSTDFITERYIIEKLAVPPDGDEQPGCRGVPGTDNTISVDMISVSGCYAIRRQGQESGEVRGQKCHETLMREGGKWIVRIIDCEKFKLRPDGWFHRTSLHGDLEDIPDEPGKDPLSVAVGHCRTVE